MQLNWYTQQKDLEYRAEEQRQAAQQWHMAMVAHASNRHDLAAAIIMLRRSLSTISASMRRPRPERKPRRLPAH
jgi:hypothetical protein